MITRGAVLLLLLGSVFAGGVVPAMAGTGSVRWACESDGVVGPTGLDVGLDTNLPGVLHVGEPADLTTTFVSALPGVTARRAYDDPLIKARAVEATFTLRGTIGTQPFEQSLLLASVPIPDQSTQAAVPFQSASAPMTYVPVAAGDDLVVADTLDATWLLRRADGSVAASIRSVCRPGTGASVGVDSMVVRSRSTTTLTLATGTSRYGEAVLATAAVGTTAGPVPGGVPGGLVFSIDGVAYRMPLDAGGGAALALPRARVGVHHVNATFLATDPGHHDTSTSTSQTWTVAKADTGVRVAAFGRHVRRRTRVAIRLAGTYDTVPTGRVKMSLRKLTPKRSRRGLGAAISHGRATADLGRLTRGKYRLIVVYRGDTGHLRQRKVKSFRVR